MSWRRLRFNGAARATSLNPKGAVRPLLHGARTSGSVHGGAAPIKLASYRGGRLNGRRQYGGRSPTVPALALDATLQRPGNADSPPTQ